MKWVKIEDCDIEAGKNYLCKINDWFLPLTGATLSKGLKEKDIAISLITHICEITEPED